MKQFFNLYTRKCIQNIIFKYKYEKNVIAFSLYYIQNLKNFVIIKVD
jgi:hypothetical protein